MSKRPNRHIVVDPLTCQKRLKSGDQNNVSDMLSHVETLPVIVQRHVVLAICNKINCFTSLVSPYPMFFDKTLITNKVMMNNTLAIICYQDINV